MTSWVRLWHDMPTDPKFRTIARAAKQPLPTVVAVFTFLLTDASANENERGRTTATDEDIASAFDIDESDVAAIKKAMQGRVLDGDMLAGWSKRQPKKEDNSAERAKAWRAAKQTENANERSRTEANDEERPDAETDTDKNQIEKKAPPTPQGGEAGDLFDQVEAAMPRSPTYNQAKAERAWRRLSKDDQQALLSKALAFGPWWAAEQAKRNRSMADSLRFAPPLDKWIAEGAWRSFGEAPAAEMPSPDLVVLRRDDPLCDAVARVRGKPLIFGDRGTVTVRKSEIEQAREMAA